MPGLQSKTPAVPGILLAISLGHLINDSLQSLIPASYPLFKSGLGLTFAQLGLVTLSFQATASVLQPIVGLLLDRRPKPWALPCGMLLTLSGLLLLSRARNFPALILASTCVGCGSAVFHPEASRVAHIAAGWRRGFARSLFQVGGNTGTALGPLAASFVVMPGGQSSLAWFAFAALVGVGLLFCVGEWQRRHRERFPISLRTPSDARPPLPRKQATAALGILGILMFSKFFYLASMGSYYTFYLMSRFGIGARAAQIYLFLFLAAVAAGTIAGGHVGDRFGRKRVIWASILGVAPFTLALPHASLFWTTVLSVVIGGVLASAFSAILVYAQELAPGRVGLMAGLFFGLAFGLGGIGSAVLGRLADRTGIESMFQLCAFLPLLGFFTAFLPDLQRIEHHPR